MQTSFSRITRNVRITSLNMRVSVLKIFLSTYLLTLVLIGNLTFASTCDTPPLPAPGICLAGPDNQAEPDHSSYVQPETTFLFIFSESTCNEDEDGAWGAEFPEGVFSHDYPDEHPTWGVFSWKIVFSPSPLVSDEVCSGLFSIHPGAIFPPPQS